MFVRNNSDGDDIYGIGATKKAFLEKLELAKEASGANVNDASNPNGINGPDRAVGIEQALRGGKPVVTPHSNNTSPNTRNQNTTENVTGRELPNAITPLGIPAEIGAEKGFPTDTMPRTGKGDVGTEERMDNQSALHEKILQKRQLQKHVRDSNPVFNLGKEVSRKRPTKDSEFISRKKK